MALDESRDTDEVYEIGGYKYVVDKDFMKKATPINIDFTGMGFRLSSNAEVPQGGSACSSCSTTGSCCS
ncbi:MAG: hypothetical protein B6I31_03780 [Desulfobacteraceae bacterium 4572_19]|nr:MAG: hypothetical protein B6I31_03780 [Desulfobacteraceae bacterium 4572_19]